jgi:DNA-binding NtrC family response regulator
MPKVLCCDDQKESRDLIHNILFKKAGIETVVCTNGEEVLEIWDNSFSVLLLDIRLENESGLEVLQKVKQKDPHALVIMLTAYSNEELVLDSFRKGAYNYIRKPLDIEYLILSVKDAISEDQMRREFSTSSSMKSTKSASPFMPTNSQKVKQIYETIKKIADKNISILLTGESGVGKEYFANLFYSVSNRSTKTFVPVNCPAIPESLAESELFGHEKGSFTGADNLKKGKFEEANGGVIFLDEIADLSMEVQAKLLRVLQERELYRLGGNKPIKFDVYLLSATSQNLELMIDEGTFRSDLFYRIADLEIEIPPLRERKEDIPILIDHFLAVTANETDSEIKSFSHELKQKLSLYEWPGNIRELRSLVRKITILSETNEVGLADVDHIISKQLIDIDSKSPSSTVNVATSPSVAQEIPSQTEQAPIETAVSGSSAPASLNVQDTEKKLIQESISEAGGNLSKACKLLGMSRSTLYRKMKKYGID